jgi:hypothetical protein
MAKSRKNMHKKRKGRRVKRTNRFMKGGDFTQEQKTMLQNHGFYPGQIDRFELMGLTFDQVNQKMQEIMGENFHGNSDDLVEAVEQALDTEHMDQGIAQAPDDEHHMDINNDIDFDDDDNGNDNNSLHLSDLDESQDSNASGYTTNEDESFEVGGKKRKGRTMKKRKGRKTRKSGKKNGRKTRKQRGGVCYGNGVGANNYDPSFSIYNTRELTLFPYKPTN